MSGKNRNSPIVQRFVRAGEGQAVDVTLHEASASGTAAFSIDMSKTTVPDRSFTADILGIDRNGHMFKLLFGQENVYGGGLLSLLVVQMAPHAIEQFVHSFESIEASLATVANGLPKGVLHTVTAKPDQMVVLKANMAISGFTGADGCLDFYNASPFSIQHVSATRKLPLEAVVRVQVPTALMFTMLEELQGKMNRSSEGWRLPT